MEISIQLGSGLTPDYTFAKKFGCIEVKQQFPALMQLLVLA
jgi:hypothetical protein